MNPDKKIDFIRETIILQDDYEGKVGAGITYKRVKNSKNAVLYIHGYMDYFFQEHLATFFLNKSVSFYAITLRKYGVCLESHQHANFFKEIDEYDEEITFALEKISKEGHNTIIVNGHSTGGLIATHYALYGEKRDLISGMILNSPFFALNIPKPLALVLPLITPFGHLFPYFKLAQLPSLYTQSLHKDYKGRWNFNLTFKPVPSFPTYLAWVRGVSEAQKRIQKEQIIAIPVIVFHAKSSYFKSYFTKEVFSQDAVLNVKDIDKYARQIFPEGEVVAIDNAMHDIVLSSDDVIADYFEHITKWLTKNVKF